MTNGSAHHPRLASVPDVLCWHSPMQIVGAVFSFFALVLFYLVAAFMTLFSKTKNRYSTDEDHPFYKPFNYAHYYVISDFQLKLVVTTVATLAVGTAVSVLKKI